MADVRIILSGLWVALMLTYFLGDVLRIFAGDMTPGEMDGQEATQAMWLGAAVVLGLPTLAFVDLRWVSIVVAVLAVVFNLFGLPYDGWYDNFLIVVSFVFNGLIIWYAWTWTSAIS